MKQAKRCHLHRKKGDYSFTLCAMYFQSSSINARNALHVLLATVLALSISIPFLLHAQETPAGTPEGTAVVETGDAASQGEIFNEVNTTVTDVEPSVTAEETTSVANDNEADVATDTTVEAGTGTNVAAGDGGAAIVSGSAVASANVINVVNTNIFDSRGFLIFLNALFSNASVDLRNIDFFGDGSGNGCAVESCVGQEQLSLENTNDAFVTNDVVVRAITGENTASSTVGDASAQTGNAYASANVINVVNTNLTRTNYLLLAFNGFGDFAGNIILPNQEFFSRFFQEGASIGSASTTVESENTADITTTVNATAETGGNTASTTDGTAAVLSGNAHAGTNVINETNSNLFGGSSLYILFRVYGTWGGSIFGLPPGISWTETPSGIALFSDDTSTASGPSGNPSGGELSVKNTNTASILNNVSVYALTGENKVESETGDALVASGDAYASANIINVANTNVVGRNWIFAIFNIFGDWNGNITFGQPDLWLGARAESPDNPLRPGSEVIYHFTVTNRGDSDATNVVINGTTKNNLLSFESDTGTPGRQGRWNIGAVPRGETVEVTYRGTVAGDIPYGIFSAATLAEVTSDQGDNNPSDNTESLALVVSNPDPVIGAPRGPRAETPDPQLSVIKMSSTTEPVRAPASVDYSILVKNKGGSAYDAVLVDTLRSETGEVLHEQTWELGEILPNEEIRVTYTVTFGTATTPGVYTNIADVKARARSPVSQYSVEANATPAEYSIRILPMDEIADEVLPPATEEESESDTQTATSSVPVVATGATPVGPAETVAATFFGTPVAYASTEPPVSMGPMFAEADEGQYTASVGMFDTSRWTYQTYLLFSLGFALLLLSSLLLYATKD
jgi:uncharacterized repeat protein (TIGR01451 family)